MEINCKELQVPADYSVYPLYHEGDYLEEYFYKYYLQHKNEFDATGRTFIPVFWTNVYLTGKNRELLQPYLNNLPTDKKYFTVSQHDDAIQEKLPPNTISFNAGGNLGGVPIPLVCSTIPKKYIANTVTKDIVCSFVGTISTVSGLRQNLYNTLQYQPGYYFCQPTWWSPIIPHQKFEEFVTITQRSWFSLAPRGYGRQSFRFFEILQLGSIPVFVYNPEWFPFKDFIDWSTFSICVHENDIHKIPEILSSYSTENKIQMIKNGYKAYRNVFNLESTSRNILQYLKQL